MTEDDADPDSVDDTETAPSPHPIEGTPFMKAAALASVTPDRLDTLLTDVQRDLGPRIDDYRRRYERIVATTEREAFLAEPDHWNGVADRLGLTDRERDAVARAHAAAIERLGTESDRREEFETALEIRAPVVVGVAAADAGSADDDPRSPD
ncbi:hypothetical protein JCM17823_28170 [Halorubrum gandharaense]